MLDRAGVATARRRFERSVDARYPRQSHELAVPVPRGAIDPAALAGIAQAFHDRHQHTYGHANRSEPVQIVSIRVAAIGAIPPLAIRDKVASSGTDPVKGRRQVWFRERARSRPRSMTAGACRRTESAGSGRDQSLESTILVPPDGKPR